MFTEMKGKGPRVKRKTEAEIASMTVKFLFKMASYKDQIPGLSVLTSLVRMSSLIPFEPFSKAVHCPE